MYKEIISKISGPVITIALLWMVVNIALFFLIGVELAFEGEKYIDDANTIISTNSININRLFYSIYPIIIAISIIIGTGLYGVIIFQLVLSAISTFLIYSIGLNLYSSKKVALYTTIIYIITILIQQWNLFLFTESIFISTSIILYYLVYNFNPNRNTNYILLSILLLILSFLRPNGVLFIFPLAYMLSIYASKFKTIYKIIPPFIVIIIIVVLNIVFNRDNLSFHLNISNNYKWIIGGYDYLSVHSSGSIYDEIKLILMRLLVFLTNWRPFFSLTHMITVIPVLLVIYMLFFMGIKRFYKINKPFLYFLLITIIVFTLFTIFTFVNWHGRFLAIILPAVIIVSGFGIDSIIEKMKKYY